MTEKEKDLLLKDLCSRLNTNLVCSIYRADDYGIGYRNEILYGYCNIDGWDEFYFGEDCGTGVDSISKIKPYLLPMSSMTDKQFKEYLELEHSGNMEHLSIPLLDWLNKNHFDYRGLIEKGLAIDATELNIY